MWLRVCLGRPLGLLQGRSQDFFYRGEGKTEVLGLHGQQWVGYWGEAFIPGPPVRESGKHCKLPSGVRAEPRPPNGFHAF